MNKNTNADKQSQNVQPCTAKHFTEKPCIERWGRFEKCFTGPTKGNPFTDFTLSATFSLQKTSSSNSCSDATDNAEKSLTVEGFYDGDGRYVVRFMPDTEGVWNYVTSSNAPELNGLCGSFTCIAPKCGNHGPVTVRSQYHFAYADQTNYFPFGTTCYAWIHQAEELQEETLETLKNSCFNKLRMCVFPKFYSNNNTEPELYPFEGTAPANWDFTRFNPEFFRHLEHRISQLAELGIEVDLILFHPYDGGHWGFDRMDKESDKRYLHYIIARLGAYRNIWWSMANEYDYMTEKSKNDWDNYIELTAQTDVYHHLLSIHQGDTLYDHWNPYITHASIQLGTLGGTVTAGMGRLKLLRDAYHKPVIYDEVGYEGNLLQRWGHSSAQELVDKFWQSIISGTYTTHGETFAHPEEIIWWSKGGKLYGESPARIEFLKNIVETSGLSYLEPLDRMWCLDGTGKNGEFYLYYFSYERPSEWTFKLPAFKTGVDIPIGAKFKVEIIDTWNMTITPVEELYEITDKDRYSYTCKNTPIVRLPAKQFMAIRITRFC